MIMETQGTIKKIEAWPHSNSGNIVDGFGFTVDGLGSCVISFDSIEKLYMSHQKALKTKTSNAKAVKK